MAVAHREGLDVPIIPHTTRTGGRYAYRRRVHFRKIISRPLTLALQTADPEVARARSASLSVRFAAVTTDLRTMYRRGGEFLTGEQILAVYQSELREALEVALASIYRSPQVQDALWQTSLMAEAYGVARRLDRPGELNAGDVAKLAVKGLSAGEIEFIKCDLDLACADHALPDDVVIERLAAAGLEATDDGMRLARPHILRARADAYRRALHVLDDDVQDAPNPIDALLDPRFDRPPTNSPGRPDPLPVTTASLPTTPVPSAPTVPDGCQFLVYDERRFSDIIDAVIKELRQEKTWKGDCAQQRLIMSTFAWITGDKALGAYNHLDVNNFKRGLRELPTTFRFGSLSKGAMAEPFDIASLPAVSPGATRNNKTINRDLSTMSTVARHLAKTVWAPKTPNTPVLDFAGATIAIKADGIDPRPPWTRAHLELLFTSPLFVGGGGARHRLKETERPKVWHDAAYFAPLLWYYHQTCREEICGLRVDEVVVDHPVPHFMIKDNDVRGRDDDGVPEGWRIGPLSDIIDVSPTERLKRGALAPYLDMAALPTSGPNAQPALDRQSSSGSRFRNGDTLLARITPCLENGKTALVRGLPENIVAWGSTEFIVLRSIWPVPEAVSYLLARDDDFRSHAIRNMTGTSGRQRVAAEAVANYPMALPCDDDLWRALSPALDTSFERIARNERVSQALAKTRDGLLPKLMSGELRVRDAEALVAA